ncbi:MAG: lysophospholipase, partial [Chloroflexi bacterium]|nr:lysophospholipase [Chloroflexota bacterium]
MKHLEDKFKGFKNLSLYYQYWLPASKAKAILLIVHGLAEHSGRYLNLVNHFVARGYAVYAFDQRGHGKSPGLRGHVKQFSCFVNDVKIFLGIIRSQHHDTRIFMVGHSLGGTIATAYAVHHQDEFDGLIVSGATLKAGASISSGLIIIARALSLVLPKIGLYNIDASAISQDKAVVAAYVNDPLVYRGKVRARLGSELIKTLEILPRQMSNIYLPLLIMHGTADRLSDPKGSQLLYDRVSSKDKTLHLYD